MHAFALLYCHSMILVVINHRGCKSEGRVASFSGEKGTIFKDVIRYVVSYGGDARV